MKNGACYYPKDLATLILFYWAQSHAILTGLTLSRWVRESVSSILMSSKGINPSDGQQNRKKNVNWSTVHRSQARVLLNVLIGIEQMKEFFTFLLLLLVLFSFVLCCFLPFSVMLWSYFALRNYTLWFSEDHMVCPVLNMSRAYTKQVYSLSKPFFSQLF